MYFRGVSSLEKLNKDVKRNAKYLKAFPKVNLKKVRHEEVQLILGVCKD